MADYRHHFMMIHYYKRLIRLLERKIFKAKFFDPDRERGRLDSGGRRMSELERKLRLKLLKVEDDLEFHKEMFIKSKLSGEFCLEVPNDEEISQYVSLFKYNSKKSKVTV